MVVVDVDAESFVPLLNPDYSLARRASEGLFFVLRLRVGLTFYGIFRQWFNP